MCYGSVGLRLLRCLTTPLSFTLCAGGEELEVKSSDVLWATLVCEAARASLLTKQPVVIEEYVKTNHPDLFA